MTSETHKWELLTAGGTLGRIDFTRSTFPTAGIRGEKITIEPYYYNSGTIHGYVHVAIYEYPGAINERRMYHDTDALDPGERGWSTETYTVPDVAVWPLGVKVWGDDEDEPEWGAAGTVMGVGKVGKGKGPLGLPLGPIRQKIKEVTK